MLLRRQKTTWCAIFPVYLYICLDPRDQRPSSRQSCDTVMLIGGRPAFVSHFPRTFEEDEFAIGSLVGGVDARWQALPELIDLHGITLLHLVVPQTPKPAVLQHDESQVKRVWFPLHLNVKWAHMHELSSCS